MSTSDDPHLWLEAVDAPEALDWVRAQNAATLAVLGGEGLEADQRTLAAIYASPEKLPHVRRRGESLYNFWTDAEHRRGLWRRTSLTSFRTDTPDWETVLDLDALGREENESWVWQGAAVLPPANRRAIVRLSRGGTDAVELREIDLASKSFVADGFRLPASKAWCSWEDADTLLVTSNLMPGSATISGYGRQVRRWRRGTPFTDAPIVFECAETDMSASASVDHDPHRPHIAFVRNVDFYTHEQWIEEPGEPRRRLDVPSDALAALHRDWLLVRLRGAWETGGETHRPGTLLVAGWDDVKAGRPRFRPLFIPSERVALESFEPVGQRVVLNLMDTVVSRIEIVDLTDVALARLPLEGLPERTALHVGRLDDEGGSGETLSIESTGFLTPSTLHLLEPTGRPEAVKSEPRRFDATGMTVDQRFARAEDGTSIPYFLVTGRPSADGASRPLLLSGYGGFEVSLTPGYSPGIGRIWLERGGSYVVANIRGGGEFGPAWHDAGRRERRKTAQDDFAAVARHLVETGVTRPERIGAWGGSNGGLLVGNMLVRHPELFGAVFCEVPLLDMRRYSKLLAGASWMAEYGDPDNPDDWAFLKDISAYHLARAGERYPPVLFTTSTRDDRVHPGHARKMAARLQALGAPALLYENIEGGHSGAADDAQRAFKYALGFSFLWRVCSGEALAFPTAPQAG